MSRKQQGQIADQGMKNSAQDQQNAQGAFAGATGAIGDFGKGVSSFRDFVNSTYGKGGEFQKDSTQMANDVTQASEKSLEDDLAGNAKRTGENTSGYATTVEDARERGVRDLASFNAKQDAARLGYETSGNEFALGEESKIPNMWSSLYGPSVGGSSSQLGVAEKAAQSPGFLDWLMQQAQQGAATGAKIAAA